MNFSFAQKDSLVQYTIDFKFNDGLFLNFNQVKNNQAVPFKNIISNENYLSDNFIDKVLDNTDINIFYDGNKISIKSKAIWGYAKNGILYIQAQDNFFRIPSIGSISFFVAKVEVEYQTQMDPWSTSYYGMPGQTYTSSEIKRFLIDFSDGSLYEYSTSNISKLISTDLKLSDEFMNLKRRQRKQKAFIYIRRFNENNPLYFPNN